MDNKEIMLKKSNEIIDSALEHFKRYLELKDQILNNEYVQVFSELSKIAQFVKGTNHLIVNRKFQKFLEGFNENEEPLDNQINKLVNYVTDEDKAEFIADTFTKVMLTNSSKASLIMGSILHSVISTEGPLEHEKLVCINALTTFFNNDLENVKFIYEYMQENNRKRLYLPNLIRYCKEKNINNSSVVLTVEKCVSSQIMFREFETDISASVDVDNESVDIDNNDVDEYHKFSRPGIILLTYINRTIK
ncbi:DNA-directed RNA polymerase [Bacillus timonensis]|uniref:DNA-directed RNA polymerase n=1 Tax=Bacillus timonensis TaxID=1033734 RepID=A0A4S3PII0_9BACI|nr:DNA-directed RNA polymerase [Bacillus timonensis]THE09171.1 DNA-directed RNA polymerase [Bacillus timonensis]